MMLRIAGIVCAGLLLRIWNLGQDPILWDEIHPLRNATLMSFRWNATHFNLADSSFPLTLYSQMLLRTVGWTEWLLRLPVVIGGGALLVMVSWWAVKALRQSEATLVAGFLAFSPYLIYQSRELRPYAITAALFVGAFALGFRGIREPSPRSLDGAAVLAALALWFHPVFAPAIMALAVAIGFQALARGSTGPGARAVLRAALVGVVILLCTVGPALPTLPGVMSQRLGLDHPTLPVLGYSLRYLLALPSWLTSVALTMVMAAGSVSLWRRRRAESATFIFIAVVQLFALWFVVQPLLSTVPYVLLRYVSNLMPGLYIALACGLALPLSYLERRGFTRTANGLALAAVVAFAAFHVVERHYTLRADDSSNANPVFELWNRADVLKVGAQTASPFYEKLASWHSRGAVIEVPHLAEFPLYSFYQRIHGRGMYIGVMEGAGVPWSLGKEKFGLSLTGMIRLGPGAPSTPPDARFLVVHRSLGAEMNAIVRAGLDVERQRGFPVSDRARGVAVDWLGVLGRGDLDLPESLRSAWPLVYLDDRVRVYDIQAQLDATR